MAQNIMITLSTPDKKKVVQAGQDVTGELHFTLTEAQSFKRIEVKLSGGAHIKWESYHQYGMSPSYVSSKGEDRETYVEDTEVLWRSSQSPDGKLGPGTFSLPFQFVTLSAECPGSFKGRWGDITYVLTGHFVTGQLVQFDQTVQQPIMVMGIVDVNVPSLMLPTHQTDQSEVGFCGCGDGELKFTANLPFSGCCVGQNFPLTVDVANNSSQPVKFKATITRKTIFTLKYDNSNAKEEESHLVTVFSPEITPYSEHTWKPDNLIIPANNEPAIKGSAIIKMEESLVVTAIYSLPYWGNTYCPVMFPITVGNVPLKDYPPV